MITKNQIKLIRSLRIKKNRIKHKFFLAEVEKIVDELLNSEIILVNLFSTSEKYNKLEKFIHLKNPELKQISNLKSPNKVLAIFEIPKPKEIDYNSTIIAFEEINDPGNLGTIIRICDWFGIKDIICSKKSVDCYNPKVIQASMGSTSRVNISYLCLEKIISKNQNRVVAADLNGESISEFRFDSNQIIFFGSESNGFSKEISSKIKRKITIPRYNQNIDSLNLANSVAIILSEIKHKLTEK